MKKPNNSKKNPKAKKKDKAILDSGELKKPSKLKPLKAKENKNWKNSVINEDEEDVDLTQDDSNLKLDDFSDDVDNDDEEDDFFDENY